MQAKAKKAYSQLIEKVISSYFQDERDELLLKLFRSLATPFAKTFVASLVKDEKTLIEFAENANALNDTSPIFRKHFEDFKSNNPAFIGLEQNQIMRFLTAMQSIGLPLTGFTDKTKLHLLESSKDGTIEYINIQQKEGLKEFMNPLLTHHDILIAKQERKLKQEQQSEVYFLPLRHTDILFKIAQHLSLKGIIRKPELFVELCNGQNVQIEVVETKHQEFFYIFKNHINKKAVKLNKGKGDLKYLSNHISDFSKNLKSSQPSQYLKNLHRKSPMNPNTVNDLGKVIDKLLNQPV